MTNFIVIAGAGGTGKSFLSSKFGQAITVIPTDSFSYLDWSEQSEAVANWCKCGYSSLTIEGFAALRSIRKAIKLGYIKPTDNITVFMMCTPHSERYNEADQKGQRTILRDIETNHTNTFVYNLFAEPSITPLL